MASCAAKGSIYSPGPTSIHFPLKAPAAFSSIIGNQIFSVIGSDSTSVAGLRLTRNLALLSDILNHNSCFATRTIFDPKIDILSNLIRSPISSGRRDKRSVWQRSNSSRFCNFPMEAGSEEIDDWLSFNRIRLIMPAISSGRLDKFSVLERISSFRLFNFPMEEGSDAMGEKVSANRVRFSRFPISSGRRINFHVPQRSNTLRLVNEAIEGGSDETGVWQRFNLIRLPRLPISSGRPDK